MFGTSLKSHEKKEIEILDGGQCARSAMQGTPERLKKHVETCESDIPQKIPKPAVTSFGSSFRSSLE